MGRKRQRTLLRPVAEGLKAVGIEPGSVADVIVSHMHFDHAGNRDLFPRARYHVQEREMAFCTGRCMCHAYLRHAFEADDVSAMIAKLYAGRVVFHDGTGELAPGITLHHVGGHTAGLQVVRVKTRRGWVVLGSDAAHFYANFRAEPAVPRRRGCRRDARRIRHDAAAGDVARPRHTGSRPARARTLSGRVRGRRRGRKIGCRSAALRPAGLTRAGMEGAASLSEIDDLEPG